MRIDLEKILIFTFAILAAPCCPFSAGCKHQRSGWFSLSKDLIIREYSNRNFQVVQTSRRYCSSMQLLIRKAVILKYARLALAAGEYHQIRFLPYQMHRPPLVHTSSSVQRLRKSTDILTGGRLNAMLLRSDHSDIKIQVAAVILHRNQRHSTNGAIVAMSLAWSGSRVRSRNTL